CPSTFSARFRATTSGAGACAIRRGTAVTTTSSTADHHPMIAIPPAVKRSPLPRSARGLLVPYQLDSPVALTATPRHQVGTGLVRRATGAVAITVNHFQSLP